MFKRSGERLLQGKPKKTPAPGYYKLQRCDTKISYQYIFKPDMFLFQSPSSRSHSYETRARRKLHHRKDFNVSGKTAAFMLKTKFYKPGGRAR